MGIHVFCVIALNSMNVKVDCLEYVYLELLCHLEPPNTNTNTPIDSGGMRGRSSVSYGPSRRSLTLWTESDECWLTL